MKRRTPLQTGDIIEREARIAADDLSSHIGLLDAGSGVLSRTWSCPQFSAATARAAEEGIDLEPTGFAVLYRTDAPEWLQAMLPACQTSIFAATHEGRIVQAMWWER